MNTSQHPIVVRCNMGWRTFDMSGYWPDRSTKYINSRHQVYRSGPDIGARFLVAQATHALTPHGHSVCPSVRHTFDSHSVSHAFGTCHSVSHTNGKQSH